MLFLFLFLVWRWWFRRVRVVLAMVREWGYVERRGNVHGDVAAYGLENAIVAAVRDKPCGCL